MDIVIVLQWQRFEVISHNSVGFLQHLGFGNPKGRLRYRTGKVINLDAVELVDGDLDWISQTTYDTIFIEDSNDFILQSPQTGIGLSKEVAGATSGVQELQ